MEFRNSVGHTSVWQTVVFFLSQFASDVIGHTTVSQTGFFNASGHITVCQTGFFFDDLDWDVNDHTLVSQTGSVVWSLTSQVKKGI